MVTIEINLKGIENIDKENKLKPSKMYLDKLWEGKEYLPEEYQEKLKRVKVMEEREFGDYL